jgi:hypothetical protein
MTSDWVRSRRPCQFHDFTGSFQHNEESRTGTPPIDTVVGRSIIGNIFECELTGSSILLGIIGDALAVHQASDASSFQRRRMDENIIAAAFWSNESIAPLAIEEFHCAFVH